MRLSLMYYLCFSMFCRNVSIPFAIDLPSLKCICSLTTRSSVVTFSLLFLPKVLLSGVVHAYSPIVLRAILVPCFKQRDYLRRLVRLMEKMKLNETTETKN